MTEEESTALEAQEVRPVEVNGAYVGGHLYYPYRLKRVVIDEGVELSRYETRVLRSDGVSLSYGYKPAPRGTPTEDRVLALDDGTDITRVPTASSTRQSFSLEGITRFIEARAKGESALTLSPAELLGRLEHYLRKAARLPFEEDYALLALCVVASYCQRVFKAVPVVLLHGPPGSGKSQLAAAMADLGCNGLVLSGQTSAATLAREVDRAGGLVVLDDLEQIGTRGGKRSYSDLSQLLKVGYKQSTSKKALTVMGRGGGKVEELDLYGLKVVTNTRGADDILGSRMLVVPTARLAGDGGLELSDPEELQGLRDDLHAFVMENVPGISTAYEQHASTISTRLEEVAAPLLALAELTGGGSAARALKDALMRQEEPTTVLSSPVEVVKKALESIIEQGFTETFCLIHLELEVRLLSRTHRQMATEARAGFGKTKWLGRLLRKEGWVDAARPPVRPRLFGHQTRVYKLEPSFVAGVAGEDAGDLVAHENPLDFCLTRGCDTCNYQSVCPMTLVKQRSGGSAAQPNRSA